MLQTFKLNRDNFKNQSSMDWVQNSFISFDKFNKYILSHDWMTFFFFDFVSKSILMTIVLKNAKMTSNYILDSMMLFSSSGCRRLQTLLTKICEYFKVSTYAKVVAWMSSTVQQTFYCREKKDLDTFKKFNVQSVK